LRRRVFREAIDNYLSLTNVYVAKEAVERSFRCR
jgi:hypothetical protein